MLAAKLTAKFTQSLMPIGLKRSKIEKNQTTSTTMLKSTTKSLLTFVLIAVASPMSHAVPDQALYLGVGASANWVNYINQDLSAVGISNVYSNSTGAIMSSGSAGGPPVNANLNSSNAFGPTAQIGFFKKFEDKNYLWGAKLAYSYIDASSTSGHLRLPQQGSFGTDPFTGNALVQSYQSTLRQQFSFLPNLGRSFDWGYLSLGIGPTISQINSKVNNLVGFADINGQRSDITGSPQSFSDTQWVWGGAASLSGTYFLDESWFLDLSYTFTRTANYTLDFNGSFSNATSSTTTTKGSLIGNATGYLSTNALSLTLNKAF